MGFRAVTQMPRKAMALMVFCPQATKALSLGGVLVDLATQFPLNSMTGHMILGFSPWRVLLILTVVARSSLSASVDCRASITNTQSLGRSPKVRMCLRHLD